jgi:catechol 2,3-dioxygenase-like lactoylglutathione lyase family enzyme
MPVIKVTDIVYGRLRSPSLDRAEEFLTDFGMVRVERTKTALYMRGTGSNHHLHVTELGESKYVSAAFAAASAGDLEKVARVEGASPVEAIDEPGGGKRVWLRDPDGNRLEIVHGIAPAAPLALKRQALNDATDRLRRTGELARPTRGASHVLRMGHVVLVTPNFDRLVQWYRQTLGFLCSDEVYAGDKTNLVGSFNRCDRGDEFVDHHAFFCVRGTSRGLNHFSYEVQDIDDVMTGHQYLQAKGYKHAWGIGRHHLGSQVYDYWCDPWNRVHEHWTDTDLLNADAEPGLAVAGEGTAGPWGEAMPQWFRDYGTP